MAERLSEGRTEREWRPLWPNDVWGSVNFQMLSINEKGLWFLLWSRCRDGTYAGGMCFPNGVPMDINQIIKSFLPQERDRTDRIKERILYLLQGGMLYLLDRQQDTVIPTDSKINAEWVGGKHPHLVLVVRKFAKKSAQTGMVDEETDASLVPPRQQPEDEQSSSSPQPDSNQMSTSPQPDSNQMSTSPQPDEDSPLVPQGLTTNPDQKGIPLKNKDIKNKEKEDKKQTYACIFSHWNDQKIIIHKILSEKTRRSINARLSDGYSVDDIINAITNYGRIQANHECFHYKWTLEEFLKRGIEKFLDYQTAYERYRLSGTQLKERQRQELNQDKEVCQKERERKQADDLKDRCPVCKGAGIDMTRDELKPFSEEEIKKMSRRYAERFLVHQDGQYFLRGHPRCQACNGTGKKLIKEEG